MSGLELIIRTVSPEQTCEVIPIHTLTHDFPDAFVQEYVHFLDIKTGQIEWRSLHDIWVSSPENWRMQVDDHDLRVVSRGSRKMLDIGSPTAKTIASILSPLDCGENIHIILDSQAQVLEISLPRFKLDFYLKANGSQIESKQFRDMVIDKQQSFGAFTGLCNKLVLRGSGRVSTARCVIIPRGEVRFEKTSNHVKVSIETSGVPRVKYHVYQIDSQLGRLTDNGSYQSKLSQIYLYALTSHCHVDQLTQRTGTEEALHGLAAAATRSFVSLNAEDVDLLRKIAELTPRRIFYPSYLRVMQKVEWNHALSPLSQHSAFSHLVAKILSHAKSLHLYQGQAKDSDHTFEPPDRGDSFLLEKAMLRDSSFQVSLVSQGTK
jgi:hypothetical protein